MTSLRNAFFVLLLATALIPLVGCGGAGGTGVDLDGGPAGPPPGDGVPPFAASLAPSQWQDGDWAFDEIRVYYHVWDGASMRWSERYVATGAGTLTLNGGGISGQATIEQLHDGITEYQMPSDALDGFAVGDALTVAGHVDGTTVGLVCKAPDGSELRLLCAPYDGDVTEDATGRWDSARYFDGVGGISTPGTFGGADSYVYNVKRTGPASSSPLPVPVSFGNKPSVYMDGYYTGYGGANVTYWDPQFGRYTSPEVSYDLALTFAGNEVVGTATFDTVHVPDLDGYVGGDAVSVQGTIVGDYVFLEVFDPLNPDFSMRLAWCSHRKQGPSDAPGAISRLWCDYGAQSSTPTVHGGHSFCRIERQ